MRVETGPGWEMRLGRWQDVLADVEACDAVITDPPYGEHVHSGHNVAVEHHSPGNKRGESGRRPITYDPLTSEQLQAASLWVASLSPAWSVVITDHLSAVDWAEALDDAGRYCFQPLPCVVPGSTVRLCGDGPSSWATYAMVSRMRGAMGWGTLPGAYVGKPERMDVVGGKPLWLMRAIVRDYSRPGDLVVDPYAGGGTTLLAAVSEGRRALGAECDPATFDLAVKRLRRGFTVDLFRAWPENRRTPEKSTDRASPTLDSTYRRPYNGDTPQGAAMKTTKDLTAKMQATVDTLRAHGGTDDEMARDDGNTKWRYHRGTVEALKRRGAIVEIPGKGGFNKIALAD